MSSETDIQFKGYNQYQWSYVPITGNTTKKPVCSTVVITNQGSSVLMIDNMLRILPNQSFTFEGYPGEICTHSFTFVFLGPGTNSAVMVTKNYST